jgi:uncharacterized phage-like protein YoqJ
LLTLGVTGHRPDRLGGYDLKTRRALGGFAVDHLVHARPDRVITGMAIGWDLAIAAAAVALDIPFTAAVPFEGQEKRWPADAQRRYRALLARAAKIDIVSPYPGSEAFLERNRWIVDRSDRMSALWDGGTTGGTAACVRYAHSRGVPVENLWGLWIGDPLAAVLG